MLNVVIGRGGQVFRNPSIHDIAGFLNMNPMVDDTMVHDLVIVGAGPSGLPRRCMRRRRDSMRWWARLC